MPPADDYDRHLQSTIPQGSTMTAQQGLQSIDPTDPMNLPVFLGRQKHEDFDPRMAKVSSQLGEEYSGSIYYTRFAPSIATLVNDFNTWSRKKYTYYRNRLIAAGYISPGYDDPIAVREAYATSLQDAAMYQATAGGRKVTYDAFLNNLIRMGGGDPNNPGGGKKRQKTVSVARDVYELDPAEARTMLTKTLQEYLGRDPTKDEIRDFTDAVNTDAADDPAKKTTTTKYVRRPDGSMKKVSSTTHTHPGYTPDDAMWEAIDEAKASPDYGEYQAISTYYPVIESLLGASAGI